MITLVLGGARSGKSAVAERLAERSRAPVTYVATLRVLSDANLSERVALHRSRRASEWTTIDCGDDLASVLLGTTGTALVDSLGPWIAGVPGMTADVAALCSALLARDGDTIIVSDEVGLGVHPSSSEGLRFRDALGELNRAVADVADRVFLVVAGRSMELRSGNPE